MAKKKADIEEKAEAKVKPTKVKEIKAEEAEIVETKPAKKAVAKVVKPDSPAIEENKTVKTKKEVEQVAEVKEEPKAAPKVEPKQESQKTGDVIVPISSFNVRYSDEDLYEFANLITQEKETALDELRMLKERLDDLTSFDAADESMIYSMHMAEQGSEAQEKEKTYAQIQRIHEYIKKLEEAMERIKNKTYGICRVCGCLIAKERLRAVPITTLSASYKIHQKCPEDGVDKIEPVKK